jgi:hypothetical protein
MGGPGVSDIVTESLKHYGVKGMKWGVRRDRSGGSSSSSSTQKAEISTKDLQELVNRMRLEQEFARLSASAPKKQGPVESFIKGLVADVAKTQITRLATTAAAIQVEKSLAGTGAVTRKELATRLAPGKKGKK